jgi:hypothetical protein
MHILRTRHAVVTGTAITVLYIASRTKYVRHVWVHERQVTFMFICLSKDKLHPVSCSRYPIDRKLCLAQTQLCGGGGDKEKTGPAGHRTQMTYLLGHTMPLPKCKTNMTDQLYQVMLKLFVSLIKRHTREMR